ncbi:MAG: hypothetical protein QOI25_1618 [Mycobacterium sp.]|nr:hypothetical protein [Mycobacterium sp.]
MSARSGPSRGVLPVAGRRLGALLLVAGVLGAPGVAHAAVTFDRAFGIGVDTGAGVFENCTTASTCQAGTGGGGGGAIESPHGVAVDAQGRILVADQTNNRVDRFAVAGDGTVSFDRAFGVGVDTGGAAFENCTAVSGCQAGTASPDAGGMNTPNAVAVDAQGRILVADPLNLGVDRVAVAGDGTVSFDRAFGIGVDTGAGVFENCTTASGCQAGSVSADAGGMRSAEGVAVDAQRRILVVDHDRVDRFAVAGDGTVSFDRAFGIGVDTGGAAFENCTTASGCQAANGSSDAGGMTGPAGVAVDPRGGILVTNANDSRVNRYAVAGDGTVSFDRAFGIDVDPSDGNTGDFENCTTASGCRGGAVTPAAGGMNTPVGVAADAQGRILVTDIVYARVTRFAVAGDGSISVDRVFGIDVDPSDGNTGDFENCTTASGCQAGTGSAAAGGMTAPTGVAVDALGRILITDAGDHRVDRFSPGPTVTVTKVLAPTTDPGTFDLRVDAVVVRAAATHGQSGSLQVADGVDVTISERAASGQLSDYDATVDCGGGPQPGTSLTVTNVTANVYCIIVNVRKAAGPGPGGGPPIDTVVPVLASASLTNRTFAVDTRGAAETAVTARARKGTVFRYTLSEAARVVFTIERATGGRKVGRSCRKQTRSNRKRRRCTRFVRAGRFATQSAAGANRHRFSGKIGRKSLKPGKYRATLVATDAAGNRSAPRRLNFKVVKR